MWWMMEIYYLEEQHNLWMEIEVYIKQVDKYYQIAFQLTDTAIALIGVDVVNQVLKPIKEGEPSSCEY